MVVRVNGEIVCPTNYGMMVAIEPGVQRVVATLPGRPPWERLETLSAGASATVDVTVPPAPVAAPPPRVVAPRVAPGFTPPTVPPSEPLRDAPAPSGSAQRALGFVSGAVGLGLLATGVVGSLLFRNTEDEYNADRCATRAPPSQSSLSCFEQRTTLASLDTVQWIGYVGGGLVVATGAIRLLTAPSRARATPQVSIGISPGGATLGYAGASERSSASSPATSRRR